MTLGLSRSSLMCFSLQSSGDIRRAQLSGLEGGCFSSYKLTLLLPSSKSLDSSLTWGFVNPHWCSFLRPVSFLQFSLHASALKSFCAIKQFPFRGFCSHSCWEVLSIGGSENWQDELSRALSATKLFGLYLHNLPFTVVWPNHWLDFFRQTRGWELATSKFQFQRTLTLSFACSEQLRNAPGICKWSLQFALIFIVLAISNF